MSKPMIGVQLYSVREDMKNDFEGTLKKVAEMGYECVEFAGYFDHSAEEIRAMLDKYGLKAVSVHQSYDVFLEDEKKNVDFLKTLGVKFCGIGWMASEGHKGGENYEQTKKDITTVSKALKNAGIQLCYHNHDFEFEKYEDKFLLDWFYEEMDADTIETEIDTAWVKYAGYDPCEYLRKYTGRANIVHLKDFVSTGFANGPVYNLIDKEGKVNEKPSREDNGFHFKPLGDGLQDIPAVIDAAIDAGAKYLIVEQDVSEDIPAIDAIKKSREYLKSLGY